nr:unnamed protein product [Digitaria exilis]
MLPGASAVRDVMHTKCLISHIQNFPTETAPAGFVCPSCSTPIWPPSSIKDTGSRLHAKLKEAIVQTGLEKNVFGNHFVTIHKADTRTPPAFASDPLKHLSGSGDRESNGANIGPARDASLRSTLHSGMYSSAGVGSGTPIHVEPEIVEIEGPSPLITQFPEQESNFIRSPSPHGPGAMTRKGATSVDRQNSEISYYADDEDGNRKKYTKRAPVLAAPRKHAASVLAAPPELAAPHKHAASMLTALLELAAPVLPAPPELRHHRPPPPELAAPMARRIAARSKRQERACIATMGILYYRLSQRSLSENFVEDEIQ